MLCSGPVITLVAALTALEPAALVAAKFFSPTCAPMPAPSPNIEFREAVFWASSAKRCCSSTESALATAAMPLLAMSSWRLPTPIIVMFLNS